MLKIVVDLVAPMGYLLLMEATSMDAIFFWTGVGFGMVCMGLAGFMLECWDKYQTRKLKREWRI